MKKYAIVSRRVVGYSFSHIYSAYEYDWAFRFFGPSSVFSDSIINSATSESAEKCEELLRELIDAKTNEYEIIRIVEA